MVRLDIVATCRRIFFLKTFSRVYSLNRHFRLYLTWLFGDNHVISLCHCFLHHRSMINLRSKHSCGRPNARYTQKPEISGRHLKPKTNEKKKNTEKNYFLIDDERRGMSSNSFISVSSVNIALDKGAVSEFLEREPKQRTTLV